MSHILYLEIYCSNRASCCRKSMERDNCPTVSAPPSKELMEEARARFRPSPGARSFAGRGAGVEGVAAAAFGPG